MATFDWARKLVGFGRATFLSLTLVALAGLPAAAEAPMVRLLDDIAQSSATVSFTADDTHTDVVDNKAIHPEIIALARSLKDDPDLMFRYVHDTIETLPAWGLKKGAMGAYLDKKGTAFDQAELLLQLLEASGNRSADYVLAKFQFSPTQLLTLFGTNDIGDVCAMLTAGGYPFNMTAGTNVTTDCAYAEANSYGSAEIVHIVVKSGTKYYDPSYKSYNEISGVNLATWLGYATTDVSDNTPVENVDLCGPAGVQCVKRIAGKALTALPSALNSKASNLVVKLKEGKESASDSAANNYLMTTEDVIGGREIQAFSGSAGTTLAGLAGYSSTIVTYAGAMPDKFRTKLTFGYDGSTWSTYLDELYGRRVWLYTNGVDLYFFVGAETYFSKALAGNTVFNVSVDHPYPAASGSFADTTYSFNPPFYSTAGVNYTRVAIVIGSGHTGLPYMGRSADDQFQTLNAKPGLDKTSLEEIKTDGLTKVQLGASFLAQQSQLIKLNDGVTGSRTNLHDSIGFVVSDPDGADSYLIDVRSQFSLVNLGGSAQQKKAAATTLTFAMSALEGGLLAQANNEAGDANKSASAVSLLAQSVSDANSVIYDLAANTVPADPNLFEQLRDYTDDGTATNYQPLANYSTAVMARLADYNDSYRLLLPSNAGGASATIAGEGYVVVDGDNYGHMVDGSGISTNYPLKGGWGEPNLEDRFNLEQNFYASASGEPNTIANFNAGFSSTDLVTGAGAFPYALPYTRSYASSSSAGGGWSHNYDIDGLKGGNGMIALGHRRPIEAAKAISALYASYDYLSGKESYTGADLVTTALIMDWLQSSLRDNVFTLRRAHSTTAFVHLADGTWWGPGGASTTVVIGYIDTDEDGIDDAQGASFTDKSGVRMVLLQDAGNTRKYNMHRWIWPQGVRLDFAKSEGTATQNVVTVSLFRKNSATTYASTGRSLTLTRTELSGLGTYLVRAEDENANKAGVYSGAGNTWLVRNTTSGATTLATYGYDGYKRITSVSTPLVTNQLVLSYDDAGNLITRTVADRGTFTYYSNDWRQEVVAPAGNATVSIADPYGRFSETTNALGETSRRKFTRSTGVARVEGPKVAGDYLYSETLYSKYGDVLRSTVFSKAAGGTRESLTTTYSYYDETKFRQLASVTMPDSNVVNLDYYTGTETGAGLLKTQTLPTAPVYDPDNNTTSYPSAVTTYNYTVYGLPSQVTAPDGMVTTYAYNATTILPEVVTADVGGLEVKTTLDYWANGDVWTVKDNRNNTVTYSYDILRRPVKVEAPGVADTAYVYDSDGRLTEVRQCTKGTNCATVLMKATRAYDKIGRVTSVTDNAGNTVSVAYTDKNDPNSPTDDVCFQGDFYGCVEVTAPDGTKGRRYFDALGRTIEQVSAYGHPTEEITARMSYNVSGQLQWLEDGRETRTTYTYDKWNRPVTTTYFAGKTEQITDYDTLGRPREIKTFGGDTVTLTYDNLGRVETRTITVGLTYAYKYDIMGRALMVERNESGAKQYVTYKYDKLGRPTEERTRNALTAPTVNQYMGFEYDDTAGTYDLIYNGAYTVQYTLDALGRLDKVQEKSGSTLTDIATYDYDPLSRVKSLTYGSGAVQDFGYDAGTGLLDSVALDTNDDGDWTDTDEVKFTYTRDKQGRTLGESVSNADYVWQMNFASEKGLKTYVADGDNTYTSITTTVDGVVGTPFVPQYDGRGNLTDDGVYTYAYDKENKLLTATNKSNSAEVGSYSYDALGRRYQKTAGAVTTRYLWAGWVNYAELNGSGTALRYFVYGAGIDTPLMVKEVSDSSKTYVHQDGKGNVFAVTTGSGGTATVANKFQTDPWGYGTDESNVPFKFTARRLDNETGNYYYRNRYYHPKQGRFMSRDPIGYAGGLNLYAYADNDPVNFSDPLGLDKMCTGSRIERKDDYDCGTGSSTYNCIGYCSDGGGMPLFEPRQQPGQVIAGGGSSDVVSGSGGSAYTGGVPGDMTDSGGATVVPCDGYMGCVIITGQTPSLVYIECRGCVQSWAMTASWNQGNPWGNTYAQAKVNAATTRLALGYGAMMAEDVRTAVNVVGAASALVIGLGLTQEVVLTAAPTYVATVESTVAATAPRISLEGVRLTVNGKPFELGPPNLTGQVLQPPPLVTQVMPRPVSPSNTTLGALARGLKQLREAMDWLAAHGS